MLGFKYGGNLVGFLFNIVVFFGFVSLLFVFFIFVFLFLFLFDWDGDGKDDEEWKLE